jgi:hypothetical protein
MPSDIRPGLNPRRLMRLMQTAIERCDLDLTGLTVLTEAASGPYVVTPVLAAMAGANVYALAADNGYSSSDEIRRVTVELAKLTLNMDQIQFIYSKDSSYVETADIVTNSGSIRPIDAEMATQMKPSSVVPLMYESWEYRRSDVDLNACRARGIVVAGTNEKHPYVDMFSFLGPMALKQIQDAGVAVRGSRVILLCDNPFAQFIIRDLSDYGAEITHVRRLTPNVLAPYCDALLVAMQPGDELALSVTDVRMLREKAPGAVVIQYWGDVDRAALAVAGVLVWPPEAPRAGHMGILPSDLGPEPVIRLQTGGLKVGQLLAGDISKASSKDLDLIQKL